MPLPHPGGGSEGAPKGKFGNFWVEFGRGSSLLTPPPFFFCLFLSLQVTPPKILGVGSKKGPGNKNLVSTKSLWGFFFFNWEIWDIRGFYPKFWMGLVGEGGCHAQYGGAREELPVCAALNMAASMPQHFRWDQDGRAHSAEVPLFPPQYGGAHES